MIIECKKIRNFNEMVIYFRTVIPFEALINADLKYYETYVGYSWNLNVMSALINIVIVRNSKKDLA